MTRLCSIYEGWEGFNRSLVLAIQGLEPGTLNHRLHPDLKSVREILVHIGDGRVDWLRRIDPEGFHSLFDTMQNRTHDPSSITELTDWLNQTYDAVENMLNMWTNDDLNVVFRQEYRGKVYTVSRQWVIWRVLSHDIYHGGQVSELLGAMGIFPTELTWLGGHLTEPPEIR